MKKIKLSLILTVLLTSLFTFVNAQNNGSKDFLFLKSIDNVDLYFAHSNCDDGEYLVIKAVNTDSNPISIGLQPVWNRGGETFQSSNSIAINLDAYSEVIGGCNKPGLKVSVNEFFSNYDATIALDLLNNGDFTVCGSGSGGGPVLNCPENIIVDNDLGECGADVDLGVCCECPEVHFTIYVSIDGGTPTTYTGAEIFFDVGTASVHLEAENNQGVTSECDFTVTVNDTEAPEVLTQNPTIQLDELCAASIVATDIDFGSSDNCGIASMSVSPSSFTCADVGPNTVTLTVTDNNGNSAPATATVTVEDNIPPEVLTKDITIPLDASGNASIVASDVDNGSNDASGIASMNVTPSDFTCANIGPNTVTLTVTDNNGNVATATATVIVEDVTPPVTPTLDDITGECSATAVAPTTTDNCAGTITGTTSDPLFYDTQDTFTITWTFDDGNGNSIDVDQTVIVEDVTPPVTPTLDDVTGECSATAVAPTTTDNCAGTITGTTSDPLFYDTQDTFTITWTFDDGNGNSIDVDQTVIVEDVTPPVTPTLDDVTGECSATAVAPTTTDNCAGTITGTTSDPLFYDTQDTFTITWTFDDGNGNSIDVDQTVIVEDVTPPVTPTLDDVTGECSATAVAPTTTDNCAGTITGTTSDPLFYDTQDTFTITWTFDDGNGNSIDVDQTVIVEDVTPPVTPTLDDVTGECSATAVAPTTTDNCAGTITGTTSDPLFYDTQDTFTITWTFDDGNGNSIDVDQTVIVEDVTPPVTPTLDDVTGECSATAVAPTTTDNCAGTITGTTSDPLFYDTQDTFTITWTFDDGNGNSIDVDQTVIVEDVTPPVTPTLDDITGECSATAVAPTTTDNCAGTITGTTSDPLFYDTQDTFTITWTFDDGNGNSIDVDQTVIVEDVTPPVTPTLDDVTGECSATAVAPTTTDNCAGTITGTTSDPLFYDTQDTFTITWTFDDGNGNSIDVDQTVIVEDVTPPVTPTLDDVTGECSATAVAPTTTDNCAGTITGTTSDPLFYDTQDTFTITWTFDDGNGNSIDVDQTVIVEDVTPPSFTDCPTDMTVAATGPSGAVVTYTAPIGTDNCSGATTDLIAGLASGETFPLGPTTVTYEVTDVAGLTAQCTFTVTVSGIAPEIMCPEPADITYDYETGRCGAIVTFAATETTGVPPSGITYSPLQPGVDLFPVGTTTVTATATNSVGFDECTFDVTVTDDELPVLAGCPTDITQSNDAGACDAVVTWTEPTATDNCTAASELIWTKSHAPGDTFIVGTTPVTYTATDAALNISAECTFDVTVTDDELSVLAGCPTDITQSNDAGACDAVVTWTEPTATDNCTAASELIWTKSHAPGDTFIVGTTPVTYTATDAALNISAECTFDVTVTDNEPPVINNCIDDFEDCANNSHDNSYTISGTYLDLVDFTDNCPGAVATNDYNLIDPGTLDGAIFQEGIKTVTWTVTDAAGNDATCSFDVTIHPLPIATITTSDPTMCCNEVILTAHSSTSENLYDWSTTETTQSIALSIDEDLEGTYSVIVTDQNGCVSPDAATYYYEPENLISSYIIHGEESTLLGYKNVVLNGALGVSDINGKVHFLNYVEVKGVGAFVKAPQIHLNPTSIISAPLIYEQAVVKLPTMLYNPYPEYTSDVVITGSGTYGDEYSNITIGNNCNVTLTGSVFENILIGNGSSVTFTSATIYMNRLKMHRANRTTPSTIAFRGDADVLVKDYVMIDRYCTVNPDLYKVIFYIGEEGGICRDQLQVKTEGTIFNACAYVPGGYIHVQEYGVGFNQGYMFGQFIAQKIIGNGKNVIWDWLGNTPVQSTVPATILGSDKHRLSIFPSPNKGSFMLSVDSEEATNFSLRIFNQMGAVIYDVKQINVRAGSTQRYISLPDLVPGIYTVELMSHETRLLQKMVVTF